MAPVARFSSSSFSSPSSPPSQQNKPSGVGKLKESTFGVPETSFFFLHPFKEKQNPLHIITMAWVAIPVMDETENLDLETLGKIYENLGAFDYLSTWENEQLEKEKVA